jgi:beta-galactosidase
MPPISTKIDAAAFGGSNVLAVHADTRAHGSRWYPGAGIYRKVTARLVDPVHIPVWGVFVTTPEVSDSAAKVRVEVEVADTLPESREVRVETRIIDPSGREVAKGEGNASIPGRSNGKVPITIALENPQRWDVNHPHLYTAETRVRLGELELDRTTTTFGVRTFKWTANDGFRLNGRRVQLHGVNLHHDHGPLGAAFFSRAMERQLEIMKEMGVNAIRTSHNAPAPELLELCDRMGLVVSNELFDKYGSTAGIDCDGDTFVDQHAGPEVRNFVSRDRNHPCVVAWSIGNEIPGLTKRQVDTMADYFRKYDSTRPVGIGSHIPAQATQGLLTSLDFTGWNYNAKHLVARKAMPDKPLVYSETASAFATRGAYKPDLPRGKQDKQGNVLAENLASKACDGDAATRWCAAAGTLPQHWQVDLGKETTARFVRIIWEKEARIYQFELGISQDGKTWAKPGAKRSSTGNVTEFTFERQTFQYLRVTITGIKAKKTWVSIREVEVLKQAAAAVSPYYRIVMPTACAGWTCLTNRAS